MEKPPVLFFREGTCALGPMIAFLMSGRPFHICRVSESDGDSDQYLLLNALGQVPLLYQDGFILTENVAILNHIAQLDLSRGLGFPVGTPGFDQLNRALGFLSSSFHMSFGPIFSPESFHDDPKIQSEIREKFIKNGLHLMMQHLNDHLLEQKLLYDHPTVGDCSIFAMIRWAEDLYEIETEFPRIHRFQRAMAELFAVKQALALEKDSAAVAVTPLGYQGEIRFKEFASEAIRRKREVDLETRHGDFTPGLASRSRKRIKTDRVQRG